ncbi:MAG: branched-chain amino acid ABC transporter permease, partial [Acidimicrobiales bacterium]
MKLAEVSSDDVRRLAPPTVLLAVVALVGAFAPGSWTFVAIVAATSGLLALSVGLLYSQVGMLSLCQFTFAYLGVWVMAWLNVHARMPFLVMAVLAGLAAVPAGVLVGGLAVRLRGVYLAVTTFTFAVGMSTVLSQFQLPGLLDQIAIRRPVGFQSDRTYFLLCLGVLVVVGLGVGGYEHTRGGRACRAIKYSERATAAAGFSVAGGRLRSFCTSAFIAGLAGAL